METKKGKIKSQIERVTIPNHLKDTLQVLCDEANASLGEIASVTKSDIVALLISSHGPQLSEEELKILREQHFDEVKFALWMANKLRLARASGVSLTIQDLLANNFGGVDRGKVEVKKKRRSRKDRSSGEKADDFIPEPTAVYSE